MKRIIAAVAVVLLGVALVAALALPRAFAQTGGTTTPQPAPGTGGSTSRLAESGAPGGFVLTTVVCDIPVFAAPGANPILNTALRAGQTWFVDPNLQTAQMVNQQNIQQSNQTNQSGQSSNLNNQTGQQQGQSQQSNLNTQTGQQSNLNNQTGQQQTWQPWMSFMGDQQGAWARIYVGSANTGWVPAACLAGEGFMLNGQAFTQVGMGIRGSQQSNLNNQTGTQNNLNNQTGTNNQGQTGTNTQGQTGTNTGQNNSATPQATAVPAGQSNNSTSTQSNLSNQNGQSTGTQSNLSNQTGQSNTTQDQTNTQGQTGQSNTTQGQIGQATTTQDQTNTQTQGQQTGQPVLATLICDIPVFNAPAGELLPGIMVHAGETWYVRPELVVFGSNNGQTDINSQPGDAGVDAQNNQDAQGQGAGQEGQAGQTDQSNQADQSNQTDQSNSNNQNLFGMQGMNTDAPYIGTWAEIMIAEGQTGYVPSACVMGQGFQFQGQPFNPQSGISGSMNNQQGQIGQSGEQGQTGQSDQGDEAAPEATEEASGGNG